MPVFTMGDRLRKAREEAGLGHSELARDIGVSRNTITNYERGHVQPRRGALMLWAMRTRVPVVWLETGEAPSPGGDGASLYTPWDSNPEPSGSGPSAIRLYPAQVLELARAA